MWSKATHRAVAATEGRAAARVTCRRCLAYHIASGVPVEVLRFLQR